MPKNTATKSDKLLNMARESILKNTGTVLISQHEQATQNNCGLSLSSHTVCALE